jgi:hypothetical protein
MAHRPTVQVNLCPNGDYWQGWWIINGERGTRGLGPIKGRGQPKGRKPPMSRRQALKRCQEISNELSANPAVAGKAPRLGEFIAGYVKGRTDLKASTRYLYGLAGRYLVGHFGHGRRIDDITGRRRGTGGRPCRPAASNSHR